MDVAWPVKNLSSNQLIAIPLIAAAIFGSVLAIHYSSEGTPVPLGMDFKGGTLVRIQNINEPTSDNVASFREDFLKSQYISSGAEIETRSSQSGIQIETTEIIDEDRQASTANWIKERLTEMGLGDSPVVSIDPMGPEIADFYRTKALYAAIAALVAMAVILFVALRRVPVVGNILLVVGLDFLGILGAMTILGVDLTRASMAGILLIFGYAVNTNILLSRNILKRKGGTDRDRAGRAMTTGIKMSSTSAAAMVVLNLVATATELNQISAVLVIGILVDMLNTWFLNSGMIVHLKKGEEAKYHARI